MGVKQLVETYVVELVADLIGAILKKNVNSIILNLLSKKEINKILNDCLNDVHKSKKVYRKKLNKNHIKEIIRNPIILKEISHFISDKSKFRIRSIEIEISKKKLFRKKLSRKEIKEIVKDIFSSLKQNLGKYPNLTKSFEVDRLERIDQNVKDMPKKVVRVIKRQFFTRRKYSGWGNWDGLGVFQQTLIGIPLKRIIEELRKHYPFKSYAGFKKFKEIKKDLFEVNYTTTNKNLSFEVDVDDVIGDPLKVLVPNRNTIKLWFKNKRIGNFDLIEITYFSTNKEIINEVVESIRNCISSKCILEDFTFDDRIKNLIGNFSHSINILGINPHILDKVKDIRDRDKTINIDREVVRSGETGLPKTKFGMKLLKNIKSVKKGEISDILYFKTKKTLVIKGGPLLTMTIYRDGRIYSRFKSSDFSTLSKKLDFFDKLLQIIKVFKEDIKPEKKK